MKTLSLISAIATILPSITYGLVVNTWKMANTPADGLKDITFPMSMPNAPHVSGFYFAQQFHFIGAARAGYTGLQPRPNKGSSSVVHAVFSSFIPGSTSTDSNCSDGADGGAGVSCSKEIEVPSYDHPYNLVVQNAGGTTWTGTLVDLVTGVETHIGSYTLPKETKGIQSSQVGFMEYYPWNSVPSHQCSHLPYGEVSIGNPTTNTTGAGPGTVGKPYETGDCLGKVNFKVTTLENGWYNASLGFK